MTPKQWLEEKLSAGKACAVSAETILQPTIEARGWDEHSQVFVLRGFIDSLITTDPAVADQLRSHLADVSAEPDEVLCRECGVPMLAAKGGTSHHVGTGVDGIDYDRDLAETRSVCGCDHTAVADTGLLASGTLQGHAP